MVTPAIKIDAISTKRIMAMKIRTRKENFLTFIQAKNWLNITIIEPNTTLSKIPKNKKFQIPFIVLGLEFGISFLGIFLSHVFIHFETQH